jgi:DNA-binding response OmpR family regulator
MPENSGTVLITTHDLETAGVLREAFRDDGYRVELLTPAEEVTSADDAALLIVNQPGEVVNR